MSEGQADYRTDDDGTGAFGRGIPGRIPPPDEDHDREALLAQWQDRDEEEIERVARALADTSSYRCFDDLSEAGQWMFRDFARAAIAAMQGGGTGTAVWFTDEEITHFGELGLLGSKCPVCISIHAKFAAAKRRGNYRREISTAGEA